MRNAVVFEVSREGYGIDQVEAGAMTVGEIKEWRAKLTIRYNPDVMSAEQIVNLINMGGFANGVGEWRPSKDGSFGTFHVETK